jgi:hypothetical protein
VMMITFFLRHLAVGFLVGVSLYTCFLSLQIA